MRMAFLEYLHLSGEIERRQSANVIKEVYAAHPICESMVNFRMVMTLDHLCFSGLIGHGNDRTLWIFEVAVEDWGRWRGMNFASVHDASVAKSVDCAV